MWHIDPPRKEKPYGQLVWSDGDFKAYYWQGRTRMYLREFRIGEKLRKMEDREYLSWIKALKKKDMDKVVKTKQMMFEASEVCQEILDLWKD